MLFFMDFKQTFSLFLMRIGSMLFPLMGQVYLPGFLNETRFDIRSILHGEPMYIFIHIGQVQKLPTPHSHYHALILHQLHFKVQCEMCCCKVGIPRAGHLLLSKIGKTFFSISDQKWTPVHRFLDSFQSSGWLVYQFSWVGFLFLCWYHH